MAPGQTPASVPASDSAQEYVTEVIPVAPESVSLQTLNENNRKFWKHAGGEQDDS